MKKLVVFLLACSLVMVVAGAALGATKLDSATTPLVAYVAPYAHVCWDYAQPLTFSGYKGEIEKGKAKYTVESNCPIIGITEGGDFTTIIPFIGVYKLETDYGTKEGSYRYDAGQEFISATALLLGKKSVDVYYKAQLGDISDQPAGFYGTTLTTTIYTF